MNMQRQLAIFCLAAAALCGRGKESLAEEAAQPPLKVLALGDSITRGVRPGVTAEQIFTTLLQTELRKAGGEIEVLNAGIGGERTDGGLARLERDVLSKRPDIVLVMYGTNDSYVDPGKSDSRLSRDAYSANLRKIVERLVAAKIRPVLMTEPCWGAKAKLNGAGEHPNVRLEKYMQACRELAEELKLPLVDHYAQWTEKQASGFDVGRWTTDQCHLNPQGHEVVAAAILQTLRREKLVGR
jgi:acyl-CoA thioesterase-1